MVLNYGVNRNMISFEVNILNAAKMSQVKDVSQTAHTSTYQKPMILLKLTFTMCQVLHEEE